MKLAERIRGLPGNGGAVATTVIFGRPTPALLAAELRGQSDRTIDATRIARVTARRAGMAYEPIAIVAMAGRFPGERKREVQGKSVVARAARGVRGSIKNNKDKR